MYFQGPLTTTPVHVFLEVLYSTIYYTVQEAQQLNTVHGYCM